MGFLHKQWDTGDHSAPPPPQKKVTKSNLKVQIQPTEQVQSRFYINHLHQKLGYILHNKIMIIIVPYD